MRRKARLCGRMLRLNVSYLFHLLTKKLDGMVFLLTLEQSFRASFDGRLSNQHKRSGYGIGMGMVEVYGFCVTHGEATAYMAWNRGPPGWEDGVLRPFHINITHTESRATFSVYQYPQAPHLSCQRLSVVSLLPHSLHSLPSPTDFLPLYPSPLLHISNSSLSHTNS